MKFFQSSRMRYGASAIIGAVIVVVALLFLNLIVQALVELYPLRVDVTSTRAFEMSDQTRLFLDQLDHRVEIILLADSHDFRSQDNYHALVLNLIRQYAQHGRNVTVDYVNLIRAPAFHAQFPQYNLRENDVIIVSGERSVHIPHRNLFTHVLDRAAGHTVVTSSRAEQEISSAIYNITVAQLRRVAILGGNEGITPIALIQLLEANGYQVEVYNFITEDPHPDTEVLILVSPQRDYDLHMIERLSRILYNDGNLGRHFFYFAGPTQPPMPYLEAFLEDWGIRVGSGVVFDSRPANVINMNPFVPVVDYTEWGILPEDMIIAFPLTTMPYGRPLEVAFELRENRLTTVLLSYADTSGVQPFEEIDTDRILGTEDITGPIPALIMSSEFDFTGGQQRISSVVVSSSSMALDMNIFHSPALANADYFLNLFNVVTMRESPMRIIPRTLGGMELGITTPTAVFWGILFVAVLPLALLVTGVITWVRRRNR